MRQLLRSFVLLAVLCAGVASADSLSVVPPSAPGRYDVACSDVTQDFSRLKPGETADEYWEGIPDAGGNPRYVTSLFTSTNPLVVSLRVPMDAELFGAQANRSVTFANIVCYPTEGNARPDYVLPNGRAVLMQMFGARMPGFLPPEAAVHDALGDLQSHQLGMVAGMRAALLTLLKRFDPAALNSATPHDGGLGEKLLPGGREARLWRELQQLHTETTAAVEDDFQAVFGRAFQQAYDKEMERLKEARRA